MGRGEGLGGTDGCSPHAALGCLLPITVSPLAHDLDSASESQSGEQLEEAGAPAQAQGLQTLLGVLGQAPVLWTAAAST